jgi:hypothetical protein
MFENYREMSADEKAQVKTIHKGLRKETSSSRMRNLAWGFVRGFPYRRIERKTRTQAMGDGTIVVHNKPDAQQLTWLLAKHIPGFVEGFSEKSRWNTKASPVVDAWLASEAGAIPAPAPRPRKPFVREAVA